MAAVPETAAGLALGLLLEVKATRAAEWERHRYLADAVLLDADYRRDTERRGRLKGYFDEGAQAQALVRGCLRVLVSMAMDPNTAPGSADKIMEDVARLQVLSGIALEDIQHTLAGAP